MNVRFSTRTLIVTAAVPLMLMASIATGFGFSSYVGTIERACSKVGSDYKSSRIQRAIESADCALCHDNKSFAANNANNIYWFAFKGMRDTGEFCIASMTGGGNTGGMTGGGNTGGMTGGGNTGGMTGGGNTGGMTGGGNTGGMTGGGNTGGMTGGGNTGGMTGGGNTGDGINNDQMDRRGHDNDDGRMDRRRSHDDDNDRKDRGDRHDRDRDQKSKKDHKKKDRDKDKRRHQRDDRDDD